MPMICFSTCIVIYRTPNEIVIGADSRRVINYVGFGPAKSADRTVDDYCKISNVGKFYFAVAGFDDAGIKDALLTACKGKSKLEDAAKAAVSAVTRHLEKSVEKVRGLDMAYYKKRFQTSFVSNFAIMCVENNETHCIVFNFNLQNAPDKPIKIISDFKIDEPFIILGESSKILQKPGSEIRSIVEKNSVLAIRQFINLESNHNPAFVGGPTDVLRLSTSGIKWMAKKKNCS